MYIPRYANAVRAVKMVVDAVSPIGKGKGYNLIQSTHPSRNYLYPTVSFTGSCLILCVISLNLYFSLF